MAVYREGTYGYTSGVDRNLYQYYFQQGFQRGFQDGTSSRLRYGRDNGGTVGILDNILNSILNLERYCSNEIRQSKRVRSCLRSELFSFFDRSLEQLSNRGNIYEQGQKIIPIYITFAD